MAGRTFLALPLAEGVVRRLTEAQRQLATVGAHVRWVAPENLHLTVKFLGEVNDEDLGRVCRTAEEIASRVESFPFSVAGLSAVPPAGQLRMVWAGIDESTGRLEKLQGLLEAAYAELGFKAENRAFRPHLTLGRVKSGRGVAELRSAVGELAETDFGAQPAEELIVFSSTLTPAGPVYAPLTKAPLA